MSTEKDEDEDLRRMLDPGARQTSARHDEAVLGAARAVANGPRRRARTWLPAWAAAAAGVAVVGVAIWLGMQRQEGGHGASDSRLATVVLSAGTVRGGDETARVGLPTTPGTVRLELDLATVVERPRYRAELHDPAGRKVWSAESLAPGTTEWGKAVTVDLDSALLQPGGYELLLQGAAGAGGPDESTYYYFKVQRRN